MKVKYIIYLKGIDRGIVLTDEEFDSINVRAQEFSNLMGLAKIGSIKTKSDCLVIRSSDIVAIHIVSVDGIFSDVEIQNESPQVPEIPDIETELDLGGDEPNVQLEASPISENRPTSPSPPKFTKFSDFRKSSSPQTASERQIPAEFLKEVNKINDSDEF